MSTAPRRASAASAAVAVEELLLESRCLDVPPGADPTERVVHERLVRRHEPGRTVEEVSVDGQPVSRRGVPHLGLPSEVHVVDGQPAPFPKAEFIERGGELARRIRGTLPGEIGGALREVLIHTQLRRRVSTYRNDAGSRVRQVRDWSVLGVQVRFGNGVTDRWGLTVCEGFLGWRADALVERVCRDVTDMRPQPTGGPRPGRYRLQLAPDAAAVFWHEAIGHALEADFAQPEELRPGRRVAAEGWQVVDDPTTPEGQGAYAVDDEGIAARTTPLIEDGRIARLLTDRVTALRVSAPSTGNGRYGTGRIRPRMSNLIARGPSAEIDASAPTLLLSRPVSGGYDGRAFVLRCWSGQAEDRAGRMRPVGPVTVTGAPGSFLAALRGCIGDPEWQRAGALCNKGGSNGLLVGVNTPGLVFESVHLDESAHVRLDVP